MLAVISRVIRVKLNKLLPVVGKLIVIAMAGHKDYFDDLGVAWDRRSPRVLQAGRHPVHAQQQQAAQPLPLGLPGLIPVSRQ
jgi:hypothetical protein